MEHLVGAVIPLVTKVNDLCNLIQRLQCNPQRKQRLKELAEELQDIMGIASPGSSDVEELVRTSLENVIATLESLGPGSSNRHSLRNILGRGRAALKEANKLDEVETQLKDLTMQVVVVGSVFQLQRGLSTVIRNEEAELPECTVGLERAENALAFLQRSEGEELRVVAIHGMPGIGKSTLLNFIWNKVSSTASFAKRAYIQVGHSVDDSRICNLQSLILEQLGESNVQFTASEFGREALRRHLEQLKLVKKPIFLVIDNVYEAEHLQKLLPATLSSVIPASSVIALTSRIFAVVRALLSLCSLSEGNGSQVYCLEPVVLDPAQSRDVFIACGGLSNVADAELVESLVPLCGGVPLALKVVGSLFGGNARRNEREWMGIKEKMENLRRRNAVTRPVTDALWVSYDLLHKTLKEAFVEVVKCFYGWQWDMVGRILDVDVLDELKDCSLIFEAYDWFKDSREGFDMGEYVWYDKTRVVMMHDLILNFGGDLHTDISVMEMADSRLVRNHLQQLEEARYVRSLILWKDFEGGDENLLNFLGKAVNLKSLCLCKKSSKPLYRASRYASNVILEPDTELRFLRLERWTCCNRIMEMKLSSGVREIHLFNCNDVEQLPADISLPNLEVLIINYCRNFRQICPSVNWCKLKMLDLVGCYLLKSVPAELGRLESFCDLRIMHSGLETLPTMSNCPLQNLQLLDLPISNLKLEEIACSRLRHLHLKGCRIEELPADAVGQMAALIELSLWGCSRLKNLPSAIGNASSLQELDLAGCVSLVELPDEVGMLVALTSLSVRACRMLRALPRAIGNASSLQKLDVAKCGSLVELPGEVGNLKALATLDLGDCKNLSGLPTAIGNASSLQTLDLRGCKSLVRLPDEVGNLRALTKLDVRLCPNLKVLPPAIWNISSLEILQ